MIQDLRCKSCNSCGGTARAFILFATEEDNQNNVINGFTLCPKCFDRVLIAATNEFELSNVNGKNQGLIFMDDVKWVRE